jgi:hypothetical protein
LEILKGKDHLGDLGIHGRKVMKLNLGKQAVGVWTALIWLRTGSSGGGALVNMVMNRLVSNVIIFYYISKFKY